MKKFITFLLAMMLTWAASAQTLNVVVGDVTYQFPAAQAGDMTYTDGTSLTICNRTFVISDITNIYVDNAAVTSNEVAVSYSGASAQVTVAGNVAQYVTPTVSGAHVSIAQSNTDAVDDDEITYVLTGSSSDGEFDLSGSYKCTVSLAGVTLTNPNGSAINIANKKRIQISAKRGTENTFADSADGEQKACIYSRGQIQLQGNGTLNVVGNTKHAIKSASYISVKNLTLNITSAVADGISCEEYFQMKSGTVTINGVGDDGIQCDIDEEQTGEIVATDEVDAHEDEDGGNVYLEGGMLTITAMATASKGIKADGTVNVSDGTYILNANGDIDLTGIDTNGYIDPSYTAGIKATDFVQNGGDITVNVKGTAGRGVAAENTLTVNEGSALKVTSTAATKASSSGTASTSAYFCTAKGLKATQVFIHGGAITVTSSGAASKGIKADDGNLTITGGTITVTMSGAGAVDYTEKDGKGCSGLNADGNMTISGGTITLKSTGTGGKGMKCDGVLTISDGTITSTAAGSKFTSGSYTASAKAIKSTGAMTISGGSITASSSSHEAIESKNILTISGGNIYASANNDAINSSSDMYLKGGYIFAHSTGTATGADGIDANGNLYVQGATVYAIAHGSPDVAFDANSEGQKKLYVQSGTLVGIGGLESGASLTQACYQLGSSGTNTGGGNTGGRPGGGPGGGGPGGGGNTGTQAWTANTWYALYSNGTPVLAFKTPSSGGAALVVSTAGTVTLKSGVSVTSDTIWSGMGATSGMSGGTDATLTTYSSGGGNQPGW
jgi:hypothetical protein